MFAVPTLKQLLGAGHLIELVVTQPDRPSGRNQQLAAPAVKHAAQEEGLAVVQPEKIRQNPDFAARLQALRPQAIVVVAYGRIIPKWMLDLPPLGNINLHASLLPKYRGAAPVQWAIANGEGATGVTTMRIDEGLDTGDILLQREMAIAPDQTAEDLLPLLAESGASLMVETLAGLAAGSIDPIAQDDSAASLAPLLKREDGWVNFSWPAKKIYDRWRGFQPWPGAYGLFRGKKLAIHRLMPVEGAVSPGPPGAIAVTPTGMLVAAGEGTCLQLLEVQPEGKRRMTAVEFLRGVTMLPDERFGSSRA